MFAKCDPLPKSDLFDIFVEGIHSRHSAGNAKHPLPTRSFTFLRATVRSTHSFVAAAEKNTNLMRRSRAFGHGVVVSKICYNTVIVLSVLLWDCFKPKNICLDWAFSKIGLEVWLPAFQLPMFAKCDTLPKGDLFDMFVQRIFFSQSFWDFQASTLQQKLQVPESGSTLHHLCIMVASCPSFRCSCRKKHPSHAEEQSVWSWSCGLQGLLQYSDCGLRFAMRLLQTKEYLSRLSF